MNMIGFRLFLATVLLTVLPLTSFSSIIRVPADQSTIQAGINAALAGDTVEVTCGTYFEHDIELKAGVLVTSETGFSDCVTVDAQQLSRVFRGQFIDTILVLQGLTITGGLIEGKGAGLYFSWGADAFTIANCRFVNNHAEEGGGAYLRGKVSIVNCEFENNSSNHEFLGLGGGLKCGGGSVTGSIFRSNSAASAGGALYAGSISITDSRFVSNRAGSNGGALFSSSALAMMQVVLDSNIAGLSGYGNGGGAAIWGGSGDIDNCRFEFNRGGEGGGLWMRVSSGQVSNSAFTDNHATSDGGGVHLSSQSNGIKTITLDSCSIVSNISDLTGGGLFVGEYVVTYLGNCSIRSNRSVNAGGVYSGRFARSSLTGCNVSDNSAVEYGGGFLLSQSLDTTRLEDCTVASNSAAFGGGIAMEMPNATITSPVIDNCLIDGNIATVDGGGLHILGASAVVRKSVIKNNQAKRGSAMFIHQYGSAQTPTPLISYCVIHNNETTNNGDFAIHLKSYSSGVTKTTPTFENCTIAYNPGGGVFVHEYCKARFEYCNIGYNGTGWNMYVGSSLAASLSCTNLVESWHPSILSQRSKYMNLSTDPLFCAASESDFHLLDESVLLPENNPCNHLIGALGAGCDACCGAFTVGFTGNTNCGADGKRNLGDITTLIDRIFLTKTPLCCEENGDVDGDVEAKLNLADITRLIDHVFLTKAETEICK